MRRNEMIEAIKTLLAQYNVKQAYLFGSFARKERKYHDIDIAIEPPKDFSLMDLVHVEGLLEEKVGKKFDLLTFNSISPYIRPYIEKDLVRII